MKPAFSVVLFTTLIGAAQGLVVALGLASLAGRAPSPGFLRAALLVALVMLLAGLVASFGHLGRKERAWRAALMWRTSWLSREVIVLPAFIAVVAGWWWSASAGAASAGWPLLAIAVAALLWYCTAMIYACLRFIQEWAQPLTLVNFVLTGLSSGLVLGCALAALAGETPLLGRLAPFALIATIAAGVARVAALRRNAALKPRSTLQSATGIRATRLTQKSMGMSAGAFNTREFFHGASLAVLANVRRVLILAGFAGPALLLALGLLSGFAVPFVLAFVVQAPGLVADRWLFFAQARHPQNLYYQVVS
ncbi:MAG: dimethyl sulfoxide reductase anchor subunit family protein [Lautropia sp.]